MTSRARRGLVAAGTAGTLAVALVIGGAVLGGAGGADESGTAAAQSASSAAPGTVEALQERLTRVPGDYPGWATLALLYVDRARTTGDPALYAKAQGAVDQSFEVEPQSNGGAHTAQATLQAAQHDFAAAESSARAALAVNAFDATAYGVLADALTELGRYDEAVEALQQMADVDPGFAALSRISYARELRGDIPGARDAMARALEAASLAGDAGFALLHLGDLSWYYEGDVAAAAASYAEGLRRDPSSLALQAAAARAAAAQGDVDSALEQYAAVTSRLPVQEPLVNYAELLQSLGREQEAQQQLDIVDGSNQLLAEAGSIVDLETALFEADHGSPEAALAAAQEAYDTRPGNVFAADALAWALHVNGRDAEALPYAEQALTLGMRPASFLFHKGMIEAALGRTDDAGRDLEEALTVAPYFSPVHAATIRTTLEQLRGA